MLKKYFDFYTKKLEGTRQKHSERKETIVNNIKIIEKEIVDFYKFTKLNQRDFILAIKEKRLEVNHFNDNSKYESLKLKFQDLSHLQGINTNLKSILKSIENSSVTYEIFRFIVDEFLIELRDRLIKAEFCVVRIPYLGVLVMTLKYPKGRTNKKTGKITYPVSWSKSLKYRDELIEKDIKVRKKGETEGENWLIPSTESYPIVKWLKLNNFGQMIRDKYGDNPLMNVIYKPNYTFVKELYRYMEFNPHVKKIYELIGNGYIHKS